MKKIFLLLSFIILFCITCISSGNAMAMCTMEAKLCPDGKTYVGRTGPNCEFEKCPSEKQVVCSSIYAPVCAQPPMPKCPEGAACIQVMPEPKTYGNKCQMKSQGASFLYDGECNIDEGESEPGYSGNEGYSCPEDIKLCSDGKTYVSRTGPSCKFETCPSEISPIACTEEYAPICGKKFPDGDELGGIKYKTFSNECYLKNYSKGYIFAYRGECKTNTPEWPGSCKRWYDGCNTCSKTENGTVCTQKYCVQHDTSKCLDEPSLPKDPIPFECPMYDVIPAPVGCSYNFITNEKGCEVPKLVCSHGLSPKMQKKLDVLAEKFLQKLERKFGPEVEEKIKTLEVIISKLERVGQERVKYKAITQYLIDIFEKELDDLRENNLDDIIDILR